MDCETNKIGCSKPSLLCQDEFSDRIISRNSSVGGSSRVHYYYRNPQGIPFKWEKQPGTPIHQPGEQESIRVPPISPPPALLSLGLPKPSININEEEGKASRLSRLKFWKYLHYKKYLRGWTDDGSGNDSKRCGGYESCSSHDGECITSSSPPCSSSSSCSSSDSFTDHHHPKDSRSRVRVNGCTPWNVSHTPIFLRSYRRDQLDCC